MGGVDFSDTVMNKTDLVPNLVLKKEQYLKIQPISEDCDEHFGVVRGKKSGWNTHTPTWADCPFIGW